MALFKVKDVHWEIIADFFEEHPDFVSGKLNVGYGRGEYKKMWAELTLKLNSAGYGEKPIEKWQKTWSDFKYSLKKKVADIKRSLQQSGGGPELEQRLSPIELKFLVVLGEMSYKGCDVSEDGFEFCEDKKEQKTCVITEEYEAVDVDTFSFEPSPSCSYQLQSNKRKINEGEASDHDYAITSIPAKKKATTDDLFIKLSSMAPDSAVANGNCAPETCKRCENVTQTGLKCVKCGAVSHSSCVVLEVDNKLIDCCAHLGESFKADDLSSQNNDNLSKLQLEIYYLKELLSQKEVIILNQQTTINSLKDHVNLMQKFNEMCTHGPGFPSNAISKSTVQEVIPDNTSKSKVQNKSAEASKPTSNPKMFSVISKEVSANIALAENSAALNINLDKQKRKERNHSSDNETWIITGNNRDINNIKGVPKNVSLHVYRVDPATTASQLSDHLKNHFPEVRCEKLIAKHPDVYASFKVTILNEHFKKAMNPDIWPFGVCISRFLELRPKLN